MVDFVWDANLIATTISAVVLGLFSLVIGFMARFEGPAKWYAIFGASFALTATLDNLRRSLWGARAQLEGDALAQSIQFGTLLSVLIILTSVAWVIGVVGLMENYGSRRHRWIMLTAGVAAALAAVPSLFQANGILSPVGLGAGMNLSWLLFAGSLLAQMAAIGVMAAAGFVLARARLRNHQSGQAILASALTAYPIAYTLWAAAFLASTHDLAVWVGLIGLGCFIGTTVGWLQVLAQSHGRTALAVIGVAGAFAFGSFMWGVLTGFFLSPATLARTFDVVLVAYAILRLQYLGLDVKVRWGLSKSTVAAVFVAVFFIVSEAAQQFFGDRFQSEYLGIAAAGLLVLAIAPLQRLADKLATKAIPGSPVEADGRGQVIFATLAARLLADGDLSAEDSRTLAHTAEQLGLGAGEAHDLLAEAQRTQA